MDVFNITLVLSAFLCSLVSGFLFAYAVVVMPGIKHFDDKQFIKTFQVTDRVIQNNHPLFMLVWIGSAVSLIACAVFGYVQMEGVALYLLLFVTALYLVGVQVSTIVIHLSLNNQLQTYDVETMSDEALHLAREAFEPRWNRSNQIRTVSGSAASLLLIVLALTQ